MSDHHKSGETPSSPAPGATQPAAVVAARSTPERGRFLFSARTNHFVSDARVGPHEAVTAGELLLSALLSCAFAILQNTAAERSLDLAEVAASGTFERHPHDSTRYAQMKLDFRLAGVSQKDAAELVTAFTGSCPIYNTLQRGGANITVSAFAIPAQAANTHESPNSFSGQ